MLSNTIVPDTVLYIVVAVAILIAVKNYRLKVRHKWLLESRLEAISNAMTEQNKSLNLIAESLNKIADKAVKSEIQK